MAKYDLPGLTMTFRLSCLVRDVLWLVNDQSQEADAVQRISKILLILNVMFQSTLMWETGGVQASVIRSNVFQSIDSKAL